MFLAAPDLIIPITTPTRLWWGHSQGGLVLSFSRCFFFFQGQVSCIILVGEVRFN